MDFGEAIKSVLSCDKLQEVCCVLKAWYRHSSGRESQPSKTDLEELKEEYSSLLAEHSPTGEPIPILVAPFIINDPSLQTRTLVKGWGDFILEEAQGRRDLDRRT
jgi:hypothetical protein